MKHLFKTLLVAITTISMLASCNKDDDNSSSDDEPTAEYTVMVYGCGGGNLDSLLDFNFLEVEAMGYQEDVQFTAMFKYSTSWQEIDEAYEGTRLLTMEPSGEMSNTRVGDADLRLDNPQNLADFITDAKRRLPAKKYILIMHNHGGAFDLRDQPVEASYETTKAVCFDDNTDDSSVSIFEFEAAMELVGERIDMLIWQACLMNTIENVYQIYDYFDYIIGSSHESYITINHSYLINGLLKYDNLVDMGEYYISNLIESWKELDAPTSCDLSLIDTSKVESVVELIKSACDVLCEYRDNLVEGSEADYCYKYINGDSSESARSYYFSGSYNEECPQYSYTEGGVHYFFADGWRTIDLCRSLRHFSIELNSGELATITMSLDDAIDDMYLYKEYLNLPDELYNVSIGVIWLADVIYYHSYEGYGFEYKSYSELYPLLDFDKATGWGSNYLSRNVVQAVGYDSESGTFYNIDRR